MIDAHEVLKVLLEAWQQSRAAELEVRLDLPEQTLEVQLRRDRTVLPVLGESQTLTMYDEVTGS